MGFITIVACCTGSKLISKNFRMAYDAETRVRTYNPGKLSYASGNTPGIVAGETPRPGLTRRTRRPSLVCEISAISRRFEHDPIPYALETDWPVGAAGLETLHLRIKIRPRLSARGGGIRTCAS